MSEGRIRAPTPICYITDSRRIYIPLALTMLRKMYLVSPQHFQKCKLATKIGANSESPLPSKKGEHKKSKKLPPQHVYYKWIKMSKKIREKDVTRMTQIKDIAKFLKQVLPEPPQPTVQKFESRVRITTTPLQLL
jgi:hypothetical protein